MADNSSRSFTIKACSFKRRRVSIDEQTLKNLRPLVSIEYVRVNKIDDEFYKEDKEEFDDELFPDTLLKEFIIDYDNKRTLVYGTVIVTDCLGDNLLYHGFLGGAEEKMKAGENISLEGPSRPISGHGKLIISVNLWVRVWVKGLSRTRRYPHISIHTDKEIARGEIEWDLGTPSDQFSYEKLVQEDVSGKRGSATVGYLVMREALSATVKVVMIQSPILQFYGTIKAVRLFGGLSTTTRTLFSSSRDNRWSARDPSIHLTRPTFALAVDSCLRIEVDLWKYEEGNCSPDYQFAMGNLQFTPKFGEQMESITTKNYGQVQVHITCE